MSIVDGRTVGFFINKKRGVKKEEVIKNLMEMVGLSRNDAEGSIERVIAYGKVIERKGKLIIPD